MATDKFYDEMTDESQVKISIVTKYFDSWASVMIDTINKNEKRGFPRRIGYVDLFAGRGRYDDGSKSTPILILEKAVKTTNYAQCWFPSLMIEVLRIQKY